MIFIRRFLQRRERRCQEMVYRHYHRRGWRHAYKHYEDLIVQHLRPNMRVLDVGCGRTFPMATMLRSCGAEPCGIDPEADIAGACSGSLVRRGDAYALPWPDDSFDLVICRSVLEHLHRPLAALRQVRRVLRPGGRFILLTPNRYDYVSLAAAIIPNVLHGLMVRATEGRDERDTFPTYYRANSPAQIQTLAVAAGLRIESLAYHNGYPATFMSYPFLCRAAIAYDRCITRHARLRGLSAWLLGVLSA